jgi:hypothetical protein
MPPAIKARKRMKTTPNSPQWRRVRG